MKITEKKNSPFYFKDVEPGQVFKTADLGYHLKIKEIQAYDDDANSTEDECFWINAISLSDGSFTGLLDCDEVELIKNCEFVVY